MDTDFNTILVARIVAEEKLRDRHKESVKLERVSVPGSVLRGLIQLFQR